MIRPPAGRCAGPLHQPRGLGKGPHLVCSHLSGLLHPPHTVRVSLRGPQRFMHPGKIPPCVCLALRAARQQLSAKCHLCLQLGKQVPNQSPDSPQSPPGNGQSERVPDTGLSNRGAVRATALGSPCPQRFLGEAQPSPPILTGRSDRAQAGRGLEEATTSSGTAAPPLSRLVPCSRPRAGSSEFWVIRMAPAPCRPSSPADSVLTSAWPSVSGRLLVPALRRPILAFRPPEAAVGSMVLIAGGP